MSDLAIKVENLGKLYHIGQREPYRTLRDSITDAFSAPMRWLKKDSPLSGPCSNLQSNNGYIWALKDLSFEVKRGEVLGIIGRNGAGKSTLLKILSQITEPTEGQAEIHGRVGSLLEVGTGFHAELTGRENIYLNGAILGMKRAEIEKKFDEIVAFAEIDKFIDTPVKHYSSGMYMRLAFAVAAHLDSEILLVDEVLAVGDTIFQKKCLGKIKDFTAEGERTVLFVTHNEFAVRALGQRGLVLDTGRVVFFGNIGDSYNFYNRMTGMSQSSTKWKNPAAGLESASLRLNEVCLEGTNGRISTDDPIEVTIHFSIPAPDIRGGFTLLIHTSSGIHVLSSISRYDIDSFENPLSRGVYQSKVTIPAFLLNAGSYALTLLVLEEGYRQKAAFHNIINFSVEDSGTLRKGYTGAWEGVVRSDLAWRIQRIGGGERKTIQTSSKGRNPWEIN